MCLVHAKKDEYYCCPGSTTAFDDYCNICPDGITAGDDFVPWSEGETCKQLVQNAKIFENGSVGCNFHKGYELSCCPRAGSVSENTPPLPIVSLTSAHPLVHPKQLLHPPCVPLTSTHLLVILRLHKLLLWLHLTFTKFVCNLWVRIICI